LFPGVYVGTGTKIINSVIMPNVKIGCNVKIENTIIGEETIISDGCQIGCAEGNDIRYSTRTGYPQITVIGEHLIIPKNSRIEKNSMVSIENDEIYQIRSSNVS
jgi:ADP-glucose pyrophosphorylase